MVGNSSKYYTVDGHFLIIENMDITFSKSRKHGFRISIFLMISVRKENTVGGIDMLELIRYCRKIDFWTIKKISRDDEDFSTQRIDSFYKLLRFLLLVYIPIVSISDHDDFFSMPVVCFPEGDLIGSNDGMKSPIYPPEVEENNDYNKTCSIPYTGKYGTGNKSKKKRKESEETNTGIDSDSVGSDSVNKGKVSIRIHIAS